MRNLPNPVKFWTDGNHQTEHKWPPPEGGQWCHLRMDTRRGGAILVSAVVFTTGKEDLLARFRSILELAERCAAAYIKAEGGGAHYRSDFHTYRLRRWQEAVSLLQEDRYLLEPLDPAMMIKAHWASNDDI